MLPCSIYTRRHAVACPRLQQGSIVSQFSPLSDKVFFPPTSDTTKLLQSSRIITEPVFHLTRLSRIYKYRTQQQVSQPVKPRKAYRHEMLSICTINGHLRTYCALFIYCASFTPCAAVSIFRRKSIISWPSNSQSIEAALAAAVTKRTSGWG